MNPVTTLHCLSNKIHRGALSISTVRRFSTSTSRKFFVGGNWKANGAIGSIEPFLADLTKAAPSPIADVVIAPPQVLLDRFNQASAASYVRASSQDCWSQGTGAFTGETPAELITDLGVEWTIVGHSERRDKGETNEEVATKAAYALTKGLSVIPCIGEQKEQREDGTTMDVLSAQMKAYVKQVGPILGSEPAAWAERFVVAYEPVWAIGTGLTASPEQAQDTHKQLRDWISNEVSPEIATAIRIIYGGSVNAANCENLAEQPDVDGFLVGGASLKAADFSKIILSASKSS